MSESESVEELKALLDIAIEKSDIPMIKVLRRRIMELQPPTSPKEGESGLASLLKLGKEEPSPTEQKIQLPKPEEKKEEPAIVEPSPKILGEGIPEEEKVVSPYLESVKELALSDLSERLKLLEFVVDDLKKGLDHRMEGVVRRVYEELNPPEEVKEEPAKVFWMRKDCPMCGEKDKFYFRERLRAFKCASCGYEERTERL